MSSNCPDRRRFLKVLAQAAAVAGTSSFVGCTSQGGSLGGPEVDAGNVTGIAVGALQVVAGQGIAVGRDAQGVYAMSLLCTHQGCEMSSGVTSTGISCGCHGSLFDPNGAVLRGPANRPLDHFAVSISATGDITVDTNTTVSAATRTPAPA